MQQVAKDITPKLSHLPTPQKSTKQVKSFEYWKINKEVMYADVEFWMSILEKYRIGNTVDGDFVDSETNLKIRNTHLICILKRTYIEEGRSLTGKALDLAVSMFLNSVSKTTNKIITEKIECEIPFTTHVNVANGYL